MANEPVQPDKKGDTKMVPLRDVLAQKEKVRKLEEELAASRGEVVRAKAETKIARMSADDDDEVKLVKSELLEEDKRLRTEKAKLEEEWTSFKEREREVRATELASEKGVDREAILAAEHMELKATELYAERLANEKKELEEKQAPEAVFEHGAHGMVKPGVWDKSDEDFEKDVTRQRNEALSRK